MNLFEINRNSQNTIVLPLESAIYTDVLMEGHSLVLVLSTASASQGPAGPQSERDTRGVASEKEIKDNQGLLV